MTPQQKCAERACLFCKSVIPYSSRRKNVYENRKYCSNKCFIDDLKTNGNANTSSHNLSRTRQWYIYSNMKSRCDKPKNEMYFRYGGRGIKYCDKWKTFIGFWDDMENGYNDSLYLDRINNDGDYCKENCRWATMEQQANNRSNNVLLTLDGKTQTIMQWSKEIGIDRNTITKRIKNGLEIYQVLSKKKYEKYDTTTIK